MCIPIPSLLLETKVPEDYTAHPESDLFFQPQLRCRFFRNNLPRACQCPPTASVLFLFSTARALPVSSGTTYREPASVLKNPARPLPASRTPTAPAHCERETPKHQLLHDLRTKESLGIHLCPHRRGPCVVCHPRVPVIPNPLLSHELVCYRRQWGHLARQRRDIIDVAELRMCRPHR